MKYGLMKYMTFGSDVDPRLKPAWVYLSSVAMWDSSWSLLISDAMVFDTRDEALNFKLKYAPSLTGYPDEDIDLAAWTDREIFEARLKGK